MTELIVVLVTGFAVIAAASIVGPRLGVAPPLVLVAVGVAASFLPVFSSTHIDPELILQGVLPPLLYSSAVSMPSMNFRREFGAISGLSVLLVVGSSLLLGVFFSLVIPSLSFGWCVALGAIISPTDAVATSILKRTSVSKRVVAMLDGESLLNDATALVVLSTAVAVSFSFWGSVGTFARSVAIAIVIGMLIGLANLAIRKRVTDPAVNTLISFTVPFAASVPTGLLHGSGLVAAVIAGLVTGYRAPRDLTPQHRLSDAQNWRTVELVLEGAVFLTMGVQLKSIVTSVQDRHPGVGTAVAIAAGALLVTILVRAAYITPLLGTLAWSARRRERMQPRVQGMQERMATPEGRQETYGEVRPRKRPASERELDQFAHRLTQLVADTEYFLRAPLGWREGTAVVWAGMRGAVTVAAAQTLPDDTPQRPLLVLVAFSVATLSLVLQGGTIGPVLRFIAPEVDQADLDAQAEEERTRIFELLRSSADVVGEAPPRDENPTMQTFYDSKKHRLAIIEAQRSALLDARDNGTFDADVLAYVLSTLDASQIDIEMRGGPVG